MQSYISSCTTPICSSLSLSLISHSSLTSYLTAFSMLLTFKNGVSEVQSIVHPGLTDLGFFVDRIQTGLMLCPPKILQPKHSTDQRAAWLKRDSNYSHIPLPFQRKNSCHPLYSKKKQKTACMHSM